MPSEHFVGMYHLISRKACQMAYVVWLKFLNEESGAKRIGCTSRVMHLVS